MFDFGAKKHSPRGWLLIKNHRAHFGAKILRHFAAITMGEHFDPETGEPHMSHLIADAIMFLDLDMRAWEREQETTKEVPR